MKNLKGEYNKNMNTRRRLLKKSLPLIVSTLISAACVAVGINYVMTRAERPNEPSVSVDSKSAVYQPAPNATETRLQSRQALDAYTQAAQSRPSSLPIIHAAPAEIDWTGSDVLAVEHSLYVGRRVENVSLRTIDGEAKVLVSIKEPPMGCSYAQQNKLHILFVVVPKGPTTYQVVQEFIPNQAKCTLE